MRGNRVQLFYLGRILLFVAVVLLAGCNGDLVIHEITPKTIVLVDALPHESFIAAQRCFSSPIFSVEQLGDDWNVSPEIIARVKARLELDGYQVRIEKFSDQLDVKKYPFGYMVSPFQMYESRWTPAFQKWLLELGQHQPGAVVILTTYAASLYNEFGPYYRGYGVKASLNCLGIPPTSGHFYAHVGVNVFTYPEMMRKFFTKSPDDQCDIALPDAVIEGIKNKTLQHEDVARFHDLIVQLGSAQAEEELRKANVLHGAPDSCTGN